MEAVQRAPSISNIVNPLRDTIAGMRVGVVNIKRLRMHSLAQTFSGWATIMWQSMKIPGTVLDTHERIGAPEGMVFDNGW